ncbi:MAG: DUF6340 family protein [Prevotella sp.]|jgi:hypothetical protein|nr:DUF6340 family protein [Prevotella sp.]
MNIDIRKPAMVSLDPEVQRITIVDNSFKKKNLDPITSATIDTVRLVVANSIAQYMNEEMVFDTVTIYPYHPKPIYTYYEDDSFVELPLSKDDISNICTATQSDVLISIDYIDSRLKSANSSESFSRRLGSHISIAARLYSNSAELICPPIKLNRDESTQISITEKKDSIQNKSSKLITENAKWVADTFVKYLIPSWEQYPRIYYTLSPKEAKEVVTLIDNNNWYKVTSIWLENYNKQKKSKKDKIKYAANIALGYEHMDDIETSLKWINTAYDLLKENDNGDLTKQIKAYKKFLEERIKEAPKLKHQLKLDNNILQ